MREFFCAELICTKLQMQQSPTFLSVSSRRHFHLKYNKCTPRRLNSSLAMHNGLLRALTLKCNVHALLSRHYQTWQEAPFHPLKSPIFRFALYCVCVCSRGGFAVHEYSRRMSKWATPPRLSRLYADAELGNWDCFSTSSALWWSET